MSKSHMKFRGRVNFDPAKTVQFLSDVHVGHTTQAKLDNVTNDKPVAVAALLVGGDITEAGGSTDITAALSWLDGVKTPWYVIAGNHDVIDTGGQTNAQFNSSYSMSARDYVIDLTFCKVIALGCNGGASQLTTDAAGLAYLDAQLTAAGSTPCVIMVHPPVYNTTTSSDANHYLSSADAGWYLTPTAEFAAILAAHDNALVLLSGHIHAPYFAPGFVKTEQRGTHYVHFIAGSSIDYYDIDGASPIVPSVYICFQPGYLVVKVRDHAKRTWVGCYVLPIASGLAV